MFKKILSNKINGTKNALFFLSWATTFHSFTFNLRFLHELKHKVHLSKSVYGIFHFWFRSIFIKVYIFVQQNAWTLWLNVTIPIKMKIIEKPHTVLLLDLWFLSYNKKLKIQWYLRELELPETDMVTNFLSLENWSFENVSFSRK